MRNGGPMALDETRWNRVIRILLTIFDWLLLPRYHHHIFREFERILLLESLSTIGRLILVAVSLILIVLFIYATW